MVDQHGPPDPHVGERTDPGAPPGCDYAVRPGEPRCGARPARHVWTRANGRPDIGLVCCADPFHLGVARNAGLMVDEHEYTDVCVHPGSRWGRGGCTLPTGGGVA